MKTLNIIGKQKSFNEISSIQSNREQQQESVMQSEQVEVKPVQEHGSYEQETVVNDHGIACYKGRWGWHPCDYDAYQKLKQVHKEVWEAFYRCVRDDYECWSELKGWGDRPACEFPHYHKVKSDGVCEYERYGSGWWMSQKAADVVDAFRQARTVYESPEQVDKLEGCLATYVKHPPKVLG